jgi:membrane-associated phospholipid phosphatase
MSFIQQSISTFFRGFGFFALVFSFLEGFLLSKWNYILLGIYLLGELILNATLKRVFRIIMGNESFPIIGKGTRPCKAKSCGFFSPRIKINHLMKTYGMPSGHSQTFAFIATLFSLHIYKKDKIKKDEYKTYKYITLVVLILLAMYMRVYVEKCHTVQQTIVGSLIGIVSAYFLVKYHKNPFDELKDIT